MHKAQNGNKKRKQLLCYKIEFFSRTYITRRNYTKLLQIIASNFAVYSFCGSVSFVSTYKTKDELEDFFKFILNTKNFTAKLDFIISKYDKFPATFNELFFNSNLSSNKG